MKTCSNCQTQCTDDQLFCHQCGALVQKNTETDTPTAQSDNQSQQQDNADAQKQTLKGMTSEQKAEYQRFVDNAWKENRSALIGCNIIKFLCYFGMFAAPILIIRIIESEIFILLLSAIAIVVLLVLYAELKDKMQPCSIAKQAEFWKDQGISADDTPAPPGLRGIWSVGAFIVAGVLAISVLIVVPDYFPKAVTHAKYSTDTQEEAYNAFAKEVEDTLGIKLPASTAYTVSPSNSGENVLHIGQKMSANTLFGREDVSIEGDVKVLSHAPNGSYRVTISENTISALNSLCLTEDDLCYSASAFDIYYQDILSTEMQKSEFNDRMKDKTMYWTATVESISNTGLFGTNVVILTTDSGGTLNVYFEDSEKNILLQINEGDRISFKGTYTGRHLLGEYVIRYATFTQ